MSRNGEASNAVRMISLSALLGVAMALGYDAFEQLYTRAQTYLWFTLPGGSPTTLYTIALATMGGLVLGLALWLLPGHGGSHPADGHGLLAGGADGPPPAVIALLSSLLIGFVSLVAGASLGPEGAILPVAVGLSMVVSRRGGLPAEMQPLVLGAGVAALLASMFGNPLAGVVPLMELVPTATTLSMTMLVLPSLVASSTAVLTLQLLGAHSAGRLPLEYPTFRPIHLVWAVLIGLVAGAAGLLIDRLVGWMRVTTRRLDARSVVITATAGGLGLGILYVIGGSEVRFRGIPELVLLVQHTDHAGGALLAAAVKVAATALCLATGYRGGKIFPAAFIGGAVGLTAHLAVSAIPLPVAVGVGMAAAMATALKAPIAAGLCTAVLLVPSLLPLALIGAVVAHTAHLLADQVAASRETLSPAVVTD